MRSAIYKGNKTVVVENRERIRPGADEVQIAISYCGICGTDKHIFHGVMDERVQAPQIIGHEMSGVISQVGSAVDKLLVGDKVVVRPLDTRGEQPSDKGYSHICRNLKFMGIDSPGAMQESWVVPAFTVHKLPSDIDLKLAALIEPLAVACHDVQRAQLKPEDSVVVLGAGPIGLLIGMLAKEKGAKVFLTEVNSYRLSLAEKLGFISLDARKSKIEEEVFAQTDRRGADIIFEVSGAPSSVEMMTKFAGIRSSIIMVAIHGQPRSVNLFDFFFKELTMHGARVYEPRDYEEAIELVTTKKLPLEAIITDLVSLDDVQKAFDILDNDEESIKILIDCQN